MVKLIDDSENVPIITPQAPLFSQKKESSVDYFEPKKHPKSKDLPDHIIRILVIMWLNSHTRAKKQKQYSTETETYTILTKWLEEHPV